MIKFNDFMYLYLNLSKVNKQNFTYRIISSFAIKKLTSNLVILLDILIVCFWQPHRVCPYILHCLIGSLFSLLDSANTTLAILLTNYLYM